MGHWYAKVNMYVFTTQAKWFSAGLMEMRRWARKKTNVKVKQRVIPGLKNPTRSRLPVYFPVWTPGSKRFFGVMVESTAGNFRCFCQALTASLSCARLCVSSPGSCSHRYQTLATHHSCCSQAWAQEHITKSLL